MQSDIHGIGIRIHDPSVSTGENMFVCNEEENNLSPQ
jgi:hypothetical protein